MKTLRTVRYSLLAAAVAGGAVVSAPAFAEVSANASVASAYLWRGQNLGGGQPVVAGGLDYNHESGLFAGVWTSSAGPANEVDLYAGYRGKAGGLDFGGGLYYYAYPDTVGTASSTSDYKELNLTAGAAGFKGELGLGFGDGFAGDNENIYLAASYTMDKFTGKIGKYDGKNNNTLDLTGTVGDYVHVDVSYAYNDKLAFTLTKVVDTNTGPKGDPLLAVSYTLPIK